MRNVLLLLTMLALSSCAAVEGDESSPAVTDYQPDRRPMATTLVYECRDIEFIARVGPGEMALWLEDRYLVLPQVRSASGTRYEEADVTFWDRGEDVMLQVAGRTYRNCSLNPARAPWEDARRRGIDFRATGNEPGWYLELREGKTLLFVGDYGASKKLYREIKRTANNGEIDYVAQNRGEEFKLTVTDQDCQDSMKGNTMPFTVNVQINDRLLRGCGQKLTHPWER